MSSSPLCGSCLFLPGTAKIKRNHVFWLSLGGDFLLLELLFPGHVTSALWGAHEKGWFWRLASIFLLLGWEEQLSRGVPHPKQEWDCQRVINSTTVHFTRTLGWRVNYMVTEGMAQAPGTGTWHMPSGQCQRQGSLPLWVPAVLFANFPVNSGIHLKICVCF